MKIKKNQVAIFQEVFENYGVLEYGDYLYFTPGDCDSELKNLRSNSKKLSFWNGNNWKCKDIQFVGIKDFELISYIDNQPAFVYERKVKIAGKEKTITTSNTSGHLTPYWVEVL